MTDDLHNIIGTTFVVAFSNLTKDQLTPLAEHLGVSESDEVIDGKFTESFLPPLHSVLEHYIITTRKTNGRIKIEAEYPPFVTIEDDRIVLCISVNILFSTVRSELRTIVHSTAFKEFSTRTINELVVKILNPHLPWITNKSFKVKIDEIGEG